MRSTRQSILAAVAGLLFGTGLIVSDMSNPNRVLAFLELDGDWDPSLAFVMLGALAVYIPAYRFYRIRRRPWLAAEDGIPAAGVIDRPLLIGAAIFGAGWGLAGLCPGPALVGLASGRATAIAFVAAMLVGSLIARRLK